MNFLEEIKTRVLDEESFIEATFKGVRKGETIPWERVVLRPIVLKNGRFLQFSYFDDTQHIAKNYGAEEQAIQLDKLLHLPFKNYQVSDKHGRLLVQITKKGKPIVHREKAMSPVVLPSMKHDRTKKQMLPDDRPVPFLQEVGIMTKDGRVKASMRRKFRQINKFLELVDETIEKEGGERPLRVVDFGCGNAYLTLAIYHYLSTIRQYPVDMVGIDIKSDLMNRHNETARRLGWSTLVFNSIPIEQYAPENPPDIVLALHACDTATDDALAQGIVHKSRYIFCAPCCHHHLQAQLNQQRTPAPFDPIMRHGIMKERLGDMLTDAFRALILRMMGYRTDIIEFVSTQHTPRNLMIRAVKTAQSGEPSAAEEYAALKQFWQVTPYLETLLEERSQFWVSNTP